MSQSGDTEYASNDPTRSGTEEVVITESNNEDSQNWNRYIFRIRKTILKGLLWLGDKSARNPKACIVLTILLAIGLVGGGLAKGIKVEVSRDAIWTPQGSKPLQHKFYMDESSFPSYPDYFFVDIHRYGENVLSKEGVERVFEAVNTILDIPGLQDYCNDAREIATCDLLSVSRFWNNSSALFQSQIETDEDAIVVISSMTFPDGRPLDPDTILGTHSRGEDGILQTSQAFRTQLNVPRYNNERTDEILEEGINRMMDLQKAWDEDPNNSFRLDFFTTISFDREFSRAIVKDIPLMPLVFGIMSVLCCLFFADRDIVKSRSLLGFGALMTILLGMMFGYGLMFLIGVPFTTLTQILPFVLFGVGLDDAFIIIGSYRRKYRIKDTLKRIHSTIEDVGCSITLTTLTTATAFALGCISDLPGVFNLSYYAIPSIIFSFLVQMTFFIALIVIDEKRIQDNRRDCLVCFHAKVKKEEGVAKETTELEESDQETDHFSDRIMSSYGNILMRKEVKILVICSFLTLFGFLTWQTTLLTQFFDFTDLMPSDSYVKSAVKARENYFTRKSGIAPEVIFRHVNQSDEAVQEQMEAYVNDLVGLEQISNQPVFFWLRAFKSYVNSSALLLDESFETQLDTFLNESKFGTLYYRDIVRNEKREIVASRLRIFFDRVDLADVQQQTKALMDQRKVTESQAINKDKEEWSFFTLDSIYFMWEFYSVAMTELKVTAIIGIISVSVLSLLFVPHWSGFIFVAVIVSILYVDLLGVIHLAGLYLNPVTYVGVLMSIGLMVDFTVHVLMRYMESSGATREAKAKDTLSTMGASIFLGGTSTLLGVLPLAFSTSAAFHTIFVTFIGLVTLGVGHGLILLPVVLSLVGPL